MNTPDTMTVAAFERLRHGDRAGALSLLAGMGGEGDGLLPRELARYLTAWHDGTVYEDPAAFVAFIDGGGNRTLYEATSARLATLYTSQDIRSVLDVGCGDGRVVVSAATRPGAAPPEIDLVEPSESLLARAVAAAGEARLPVRAHHRTVQHFLAESGDARWDLCQATFALHAIPESRRSDGLAALRSRVDRLMIAEFDVPVDADGGLRHLEYLADRYEAGLAEYVGDGGLVAQGFLMPMLLGQIEPGATRNTWEQPAAGWAAQLRSAGWRQVHVEPLCDYWWAPAVVLIAESGMSGR